MIETETFKEQLNSIISDYESTASESKYSNLSDLPFPKITELQMRCITVIERVAGRGSTYFKKVKQKIKKGNSKSTAYNVFSESLLLPRQIGIAKALLHDIEKGLSKIF